MKTSSSKPNHSSSVHSSGSSATLRHHDSDDKAIREDTASPTSSSAAESHAREPKGYLAKADNRQVEWRWNRPLLLSTLACLTLIALGSFASYRYHTTQTSKTYFARAKAARESGDLAGQARLLQRYLLIHPEDLEAVVTVAIATDEAVASASPAERGPAIDRARRLLSSSIARLGSQNPEQVKDLRGRLIERLIQLGGPWHREAERQVVAFAADATDAQANRWMADALVGQVRSATYESRNPNKYDPENDYWNWLSQQKPGEVLIKAISLNPTDAELIGRLVEFSQASPQMFEQTQGSTEQRAAALAQRVAITLEGLAANTDSRSRWIRFRFEQGRGQIERADQILLAAAEDAAVRLALAATQASIQEPDQKGAGQTSGGAESDRPASDDPDREVTDPQSYLSEDQAADQTWDFILLSEAARRVSDSDRRRARSYYEQLTAYRPSSVPPNVAENVYLLSGQLVLRQGDAEGAIEIWERGLALVPSSLDLLGALARTRIAQLQTNPSLLDGVEDENLPSDAARAEQNGDIDQAMKTATESLTRFRDATESLSTRMLRASDAELPRDAKMALGRQIETARWRIQVLDAVLATMDDRSLDAIADLRSALASNAEVEATERIAVALQLASLYQAEGSWDQVAMTLEDAIKRSPQDVALRAQAADAWGRAGDQNQARLQWRMVGSSQSIGTQVALIEAQLLEQSRLPPSQQDYSDMRIAIRNARNRQARPIDEPAAAGVNAVSDPNEEASETGLSGLEPVMSETIARLEIVSALVPPAGMEAARYWLSSEFAESIAGLAQAHPNNRLIQAFAAERLAMLGRKEETEQAFDRLTSLLGADSIVAALVQARIKASQGDTLGASKLLVSHAESRIVGRRDQDTDNALRIAASYAVRGSEPELAYQTLLKIPAKRRSLSTDFLLARLAQDLPEDSSVFTQDAAVISPQQLSLDWEKHLEQREGDTGTYWRFLRITRLIDELQSQGQAINRGDPKLREARENLKELLALRPRWGEAISLEGWLSALEGQTERAVEFLRRGIDAGDRRMQTRSYYWQQLVLLGREAEVDADIHAMAAASSQTVEQYASTRIQLAVRQGDYQRSVEVARQAVDQRPQDAVTQLVFARTAALAAIQPELAESKSALLQQARQAVEIAASMDDANEISVTSARMAVTVAAGDGAAIRAEISKLDESTLPEFERLMLSSQALVAIQDYDAALTALKQADEIRPSSRTKLAVAALYHRLNRNEDEVAALRRAQQLDPKNAMLRNRLAEALIARDSEKIDWREMEQLLNSSEGVTENNTLLHAILLGTRGDEQQQDRAVTMLRGLIQERNASSDDAARALAALRSRTLERLIAETDEATGNVSVSSEQRSPESRSPEAAQLRQEVRELFDSLTTKSPSEANDLYRYADFLLLLGDADDLAKIAQLLERLKSSPRGAVASLEIGIRYAQKIGNQEELPAIIKQWADRVAIDGGLEGNNAAATAGASLVKLGLTAEGLQWLKLGYEQDPKSLANYVITLVQLKRTDEARELSASHYEAHRDRNSALLLSDLLLSQPETERNPNHQQFVDQAVENFNDDASLLESAATLRMQQNDYAAAIDLFQRAKKIEPLSVRTLNNLAMALSEVPGREAEGLPAIEQAINLAGEIPELLDTRGVVLLKARRLVEAEQVLRSAIAQAPDEPRYQFHLVLSLLQQGKQEEAMRYWGQLKIDQFDLSGLTSAEKQLLEQMKKTHGT
jgi:predicted Zn-dependent protease